MVEFDYSDLAYYCMATDDELIGSTEDQYLYIDNGSNVLAVAHVDTVARNAMAHNYHTVGNVVHSIALDDRLGVWIILELLPMWGIFPDVLLTRDEEIGRSTAQFFNAKKDYNWIFSFDRRGNDVVMYDYETSDLTKLVKSYGFNVGTGSFSDICYLDHLGVSGFNFGTCYHREHSYECHADMALLLLQLRKFMKFYESLESTKLDYIPFRASIFDNGHVNYDDDYYFGDDVDLDDDWIGLSRYHGKLSVCVHCDHQYAEFESGKVYSDICCYCEDSILLGGEKHG